MNILQTITQRTIERIEQQKIRLPFNQLVQLSDECEGSPYNFKDALVGEEMRFICEVKKASPSKGIIAEYFPYLEIAKQYEEAGAHAISVLTEPYFFQGHDAYLQEISNTVNIPLLRKDFIVDPYMIYEAKLLGASAVLFICSILDLETLRDYLQLAKQLGLSALVETHDEQEVEMALQAGAEIIGVNNRNLKTFEVDIRLSERLRQLVPREILFVSESGIKTREDVLILQHHGVNAVLIGESIMRSADKKNAILKLRGQERC